GTIYAAFYSWTSWVKLWKTGTATADVVVVRDDNWGTGATPFGDLTGVDLLAGHQVVTGSTIPLDEWFGLGFNRLVGSNLSLAVDPRNSDIVYVAWADSVSGYDYTLHVWRSADRGVSWSALDHLLC